MVNIAVNLTQQGRRTLVAMQDSQQWMARSVMPQITLWLGRRIERYGKRLAPVRSGGGRRSIGVAEIEGGHAIVSDLHMLVMEEGRKPNSTMPPIEPLERWGWRVLKQRGLGFVLARSIARKGIKPRRFFEKAIDRATVQEKARLDKEVGTVIRRELRKRSGGGGSA